MVLRRAGRFGGDARQFRLEVAKDEAAAGRLDAVQYLQTPSLMVSFNPVTVVPTYSCPVFKVS